jgi:hypothetical protein
MAVPGSWGMRGNGLFQRQGDMGVLDRGGGHVAMAQQMDLRPAFPVDARAVQNAGIVRHPAARSSVAISAGSVVTR